MTYTDNLPLSTDKIRNFPGDVSTNEWPRLRALITADHQFNNAAASNDGYHKIVHWIRQAGTFNDGTPAAAPIDNTGLTYTKRQSDGAATPTYREALFFKNGTPSAADDGSVIETQITACPIRAMVTFPGNDPTVSTFSFNATADYTGPGVTPGLYTITMGAGTVPTARYAVQVSTIRNNAGAGLLTSGILNQSTPTTTSFRIRCGDSNGLAESPTQVSVFVVGG